MNTKQNNYAFVDGQNLHMGTTKNNIPWKVDLHKFRIYLEKKYNVHKAFYFLGFEQVQNQDLYKEIKHAGFMLIFKEHHLKMIGTKKGNVDSDIIFHIMKKVYEKEPFDKIVLISGDGDYKLLVDFLIQKNKFLKILFPEKNKASSLYKKIPVTYFDSLDTIHIKQKIQFIKEKRPLDY